MTTTVCFSSSLKSPEIQFFIQLPTMSNVILYKHSLVTCLKWALNGELTYFCEQ